MLQVTELDFSKCRWNDENWESLCVFLAHTTLLQTLSIEPRACISYGRQGNISDQATACTTLLLQAMRTNTSLVHVEFGNFCEMCDHVLWNARAPGLIRRNQIAAMARTPVKMQRSIMGMFLERGVYHGNFASFLYLALRSCELNADFMSRLHSLMSAANEPIESIVCDSSSEISSTCDCHSETGDHSEGESRSQARGRFRRRLHALGRFLRRR
jgi:hypothetical protein